MLLKMFPLFGKGIECDYIFINKDYIFSYTLIYRYIDIIIITIMSLFMQKRAVFVFLH